MAYPNFSEERKLWKKGYKRVASLDEAGRGPLAGPVVAAAVTLKISNFPGPSEARNSPEGCFLISKQVPKQPYGESFASLDPAKFKCSKRVLNFGHLDFDIVSNFVLRASNLRLKDSKKLTQKKREEFYRVITKCPFIGWGIGRVSEKVIDKINILEATKLAMKRAIKKLKIDYLIIDGNFTIDSKIPQKSIIKADEKVFSCAASSIIAKVCRDAMMKRYHRKYPEYNFAKHKGYPTKQHFKMLKKYGPCKIHRKSFRPIHKLELLDAHRRTPRRVAAQSSKRKTIA